jgi:hypothetical protein
MEIEIKVENGTVSFISDEQLLAFLNEKKFAVIGLQREHGNSQLQSDGPYYKPVENVTLTLEELHSLPQKQINHHKNEHDR